MLVVDSSIAVKWYKPGERFESEALDLRSRLSNSEAEAAACEILSLEVVRALKRTQSQEPHRLIPDDAIEEAYDNLEELFGRGWLLECSVREVKPFAKTLQLELGLFMADALHVATALQLNAEFLVADDRHLLGPEVLRYLAARGVKAVNLPGLLAALDATP